MNELSYWLYRFAVMLVPLLPERFGYWLFARIGDLLYLIGSSARATYLSNLRHVLGEETPPEELERIARRATRNLLKNYFDLFRAHRLSPAQVWAKLEQVCGLEHLNTALAMGKGVVGGSIHFGNFNMFIHLAAVYMDGKTEIVAPVERLNPPQAFELLTKLRAAHGITLIPVDTAGRVLIKKLKEGAILGLALDYDVTGTGQIVPFFGAPARLPDGAAALSAKYGAPLILGFIRRLDNNKCKVTIEPPYVTKPSGDLVKDTRATLMYIVERMEFWIRKYPDQWLMFQPIWQEAQEPNG